MTGRCGEDVCITCSDELVAVRIVSVSEDGSTARVDAGARTEEVCVELLESPMPGEVVLVHGGVALQRAAGVAGEADR